jgi:phosphoribosylaminoimidazole-succinocarboxamide synthase
VLIIANTTKKTQRDFFNEIIELATQNEREDIVGFCKERIAALDKKKSATASKKNTANTELAEIVFEALAGIGEDATISQVMKQDDRLNELSNQKVTALMKSLVNDGRVERDNSGKKTVFRVIAA